MIWILHPVATAISLCVFTISTSEFCRDEAKLSLEQDDKLLLTNVLLLARQCSLEGSHIFPSYASWFQVQPATGLADHASLCVVH